MLTHRVFSTLDLSLGLGFHLLGMIFGGAAKLEMGATTKASPEICEK